MQLTFGKLRWRNFLKTGNAWNEIDLSEHRTTLVIGKNGAGKSTILDVLAFVLFGRPFRKINKGLLVNSITRKELLVECEFTIGRDNYLVRRGMKPTVFEIYRNGNLINEDAASRDYQIVLEGQILRLNFKSFCQVDILGSAGYVPFMELPAASRREVVEDLLDLQIFSIMNALVKRRIEDGESGLRDANGELKSVGEQISIIESSIRAVEAQSERMIAEKMERIEKAQGDHDEIVGELEFARADLAGIRQTNIEKLRTNRTQLEGMRAKIDNRIENAKREKAFFVEHTKCSTCKQDITEDFRQRIIGEREKLISELLEGGVKLDTKYNELVAQINEANKANTEAANIRTNIRHLEVRERSSEKYLSELRAEVERIGEDNTVIDTEKLTELRGRREELKRGVEEITKRQELLRIAQMMLKDSGIKSKIIKQYIPIINRLINKYLASMDFYVNFELDENFNERILSRFRDEFVYNSFSEGEKFRINLAILFAWRALARLRNSIDTNLLIFDEILDTSLDADGIEVFMRIIEALGDDTNVFVISHRGDTILDKFQHAIKFKSHKNFSQLEELV